MRSRDWWWGAAVVVMSTASYMLGADGNVRFLVCPREGVCAPIESAEGQRIAREQAAYPCPATAAEDEEEQRIEAEALEAERKGLGGR